MYLSKLEIFGFKSFANKTVLHFSNGITGIVGPNGCGKTNIVDAIRWCLGEQRTSTLRSDKMENVIFNGTRQKKPMGMSEVSLTLVNDSGILPTEYTEVTITRRIFRSGESEYLLNKNICRLKDITNLFLDTGMGTNAYSVIELKMVETILSSRTEERRHMFEEAAGVNKYKLRRRLSLKKLDDVKADLTRVKDIVAEVEKAVRSLERQAKRADQYNKIQAILREKELDLAERELSLLNKKRNISLIEFNALKSEREKIDTEIQKIENELIVYRNKINHVENKLSDKRTEIIGYTDKIHNIQKNISVAEERIKFLDRNIENYKEELNDLRKQHQEINIQIVNYKENLGKFNIEIQEKQNEINKTFSLIEEKQNLVIESKNVLKSYTDEVLNRIKNLSTLESKLSGLKDNYVKKNENLDNLNRSIQNITTNIAKTVGYLEELATEKTQAEEKLYASESLFSEKQKEKDRLEKEITTLKEKELEEKSTLKTLKDKIEFLKTLIANLEGISNASKALIESSEWTSNPKNLFADIGNTDEKHRFAIETSLKNVLNNLLVENISDLEKAISYLKKNDLGKASFYLMQKEKKKNRLFNSLTDLVLKSKIKKISKDMFFDRWAHTVVQTETKWQPYFKSVLLKTAIVSDLQSALRLSSKYPDFDFVTLEGDIIQSNGVIQAGSAPKIDDTLFGRKQLLEKLIGEIGGFESRLKQLKSEIEQKEFNLSKIDLKNLSDQGKLLLNDINNIEKQISQLEFEKKKSSEEIEKIQNEIHDLVTESKNLDSEILKSEENVKILKSDKETTEIKLNQLEYTLSEAEKDYNNIVTEQNKRQLELERLLGQFQNTENAINRAEKNKSTVIDTMEKRNLDIRKFENEIEEIRIQLKDAEQEFNNYSSFKDNLVREEKEMEVDLNSIKKESSIYEESLNKYRGNRQEISEEIHNLDLKLNEIKLRIENLLANIKENYSLEIEVKEYDDLDTYDFEENSKNVHSLKEKLKNLGPINLLAYSEYEEEKGRLDFLQQQQNDLIQSEKDLIKTIHEINDTAQNLFLQTFEQIRNNFKSIFQTLFNPGDEADLVFDENVDPLEAKIEIIAKPKGKRPTSIELLSGGEKTLTATALLFAIYLVKPSPFCILDEVDAPLDDANIDRFSKLIKEFSKKTQFIIVTHNKRTMESTETMYGVTMQEEGVSKIVGVKFNEELAINS